MHFRPLMTAATLALATTPAVAGGYIAPFPITPIFAPAPVMPAPAPGFTLCGEPAVCLALALLIIGALVGGSDHDAPPKVVVPPPIDPPPLDPEPEPSPVPLPLSGVLLAGGLASLPLLRRRRNAADLQFPGSGWPGHDPLMPPGGYAPGTAILG